LAANAGSWNYQNASSIWKPQWKAARPGDEPWAAFLIATAIAQRLSVTDSEKE